ncbi:BTAD domain-containing putative transcriptional regulator [Streptomyces sp. NPDC053048]|uniref:AfsR/SARP family transcriptional regulator n=1 Tax=Streptomyces sp. NPDC053048 TaxID=3365694 RepID=UPI0037CE551B
MTVPEGPKLRKILALLALRSNQVVSCAEIMEELWGDEPPRTALPAIRTHLYHLRQAMRKEIGEKAAADLIGTRGVGYVFRAEPGQVDVESFRRLARRGEDLMEVGRLTEGAWVLTKALDMWRGDALTDIARGQLLEGHVRQLREIRTRALRQRIQADLRLGRHGRVVVELQGLMTAHTLDEPLHFQYITALIRSGRRADALLAYDGLRRSLRDELGLEPCRELQELQREILSGMGVPRLPFGASVAEFMSRSLPKGDRHLSRVS